MLKHRITFVDLETGGLDANRHPIVQIAAVTVNHDFSSYRTFERKIKFDVSQADPESLAINSYDEALWAEEAVEEQAAAHDFAVFLKRAADIPKVSRKGNTYKVAQMAAHNAPFDRGFLFAWFKRLDMYLPGGWHVIDTMQLALLHNTLHGTCPPSLKLSDLCDFYDIAFDNAHDALADVMATARLGRHLLMNLGGKG
ncbi:MAG: exonuclease domain-containing protein [Candidatus Promineifilaceae bacterium]